MIVLIPYSITAKYSSLTFKSSPWLPSPYTHPGQVLTLQGTAGGVGTQCSNPGSVSNSRVTLGKPFYLSRSSIFFFGNVFNFVRVLSSLHNFKLEWVLRESRGTFLPKVITLSYTWWALWIFITELLNVHWQWCDMIALKRKLQIWMTFPRCLFFPLWFWSCWFLIINGNTALLENICVDRVLCKSFIFMVNFTKL